MKKQICFIILLICLSVQTVSADWKFGYIREFYMEPNGSYQIGMNINGTNYVYPIDSRYWDDEAKRKTFVAAMLTYVSNHIPIQLFVDGNNTVVNIATLQQ